MTRSRPDLAQQLAHQIVELIGERQIEPGERLPTMRDLAQLFQVATPTMREALRLLQATGVIDIRHGSGIYLLRREQGMMIPNPHYGDLAPKSLLDLLDARLLVEPHVASLAATRVTTADVLKLESVLADAEQYLTGQDVPLGETNMGFHIGIARVAGNPILAQMLESLVELYSSEQIAILEIYNARHQDHRDHIRILEAISRRDAAESASRMQEHLSNVRAVIVERLQSSSGLRMADR